MVTIENKSTLHAHSPVIVFEPWPPVWGSQESLYSTSQIYKQVTHQEKPVRRTTNGQILKKKDKYKNL